MENIKIFKDIDLTAQKDILSSLEIEVFTSWQKVFSQGEESNWKWYILKSGEVSVFLNDAEIATLHDWDIFWEIAVLSEDERTATVIANTNLECYVITQEDIIHIANEHSNLINKEIMDRLEMNNFLLEG